MNVTLFAEADEFAPPRHLDVTARLLQGGSATPADIATVALARTAPAGGAEMEAAPAGKIYVLIEGEIIVTIAEQPPIALGPKDSCFIPGGEARAFVNPGETDAVMLVVTPAALRV
jgi:quercetin dioxygenase-like cupin family protein